MSSNKYLSEEDLCGYTLVPFISASDLTIEYLVKNNSKKSIDIIENMVNKIGINNEIFDNYFWKNLALNTFSISFFEKIIENYTLDNNYISWHYLCQNESIELYRIIEYVINKEGYNSRRLNWDFLVQKYNLQDLISSLIIKEGLQSSFCKETIKVGLACKCLQNNILEKILTEEGINSTKFFWFYICCNKNAEKFIYKIKNEYPFIFSFVMMTPKFVEKLLSGDFDNLYNIFINDVQAFKSGASFSNLPTIKSKWIIDFIKEINDSTYNSLLYSNPYSHELINKELLTSEDLDELCKNNSDWAMNIIEEFIDKDIKFEYENLLLNSNRKAMDIIETLIIIKRKKFLKFEIIYENPNIFTYDPELW